MFNLMAFLAENSAAYAVFIVRIALAAIMLVCTAFIIIVVMKQSGNTDGLEAMTGSSKSDDNESYYGKNASERKEAKLKLWTYISAGALALCAVVMLVLQAIFPIVS